MKTRTKGLLTLVGVLVLLAVGVVVSKVPAWKAEAKEIVAAAQAAGADINAQKAVLKRAKALPPIYPLTQVRRAARAGERALAAFEDIQEAFVPENGALSQKRFVAGLAAISDLSQATTDARRAVSRMPNALLTPAQQAQKATAVELLTATESVLAQANELKKAVQEHFAERSRVLILLQNQNEIRPSGGFAGSLALVDFEASRVTGQFRDIYSLDRLVPDEAKADAPSYFHPLSKVISLRDVNLTRDWQAATRAYRHFFSRINQRPPDTVVAVNLSLIKEVLMRIGPVYLPEWDVTLTDRNFDLILSFLVESKAAGRFSTKEPVLDAATALLAKAKEAGVEPSAWSDFDLAEYLKSGHMMVWSRLPQTQNLARAWQAHGHMTPETAVDDHFGVDFVSIGANKSDRFVWTKIYHDTRLMRSGSGEITIGLRRTHALKNGELDALLGLNKWPANLKNLLDTPTMWKLGLGENRVVARVYAPLGAQLTAGTSPTGPVTEGLSPDGRFKLFLIPMNVKPGESVAAQIQYSVPLGRGSSDWRPYALQLYTTPAIARAEILKTLSTEKNALQVEQTENVGIPQKLVKQVFRGVARWAD